MRAPDVAAAKLLIVNADDFGFTSDVNAGIADAHERGILTATTLMANGGAFEDAVRLAHQIPSLDVGCHLVLIQGMSLMSGEPLPANWRCLLQALLTRRLDPYRELRAQVDKITSVGIRPSHFDTHKHTHVLPKVFAAVVRLAQEYRVPFLRLPFDVNWLPVQGLDRSYRAKVASAQLRTTDNFIGFRLTDHLTEQTLSRALSRLPPGSTEFMCHPGYLGDELAQAQTRLKETRVKELEALTSPLVRQVIEEQQIRLTNYRELE
jgi:chitin disaccharide deacetylase